MLKHSEFQEFRMKMVLELWITLFQYGYHNYSVSSMGRIRNNHTNKLLKGTIPSTGYVVVQLKNSNNKYHSKYVHRLVLFSFIGHPEVSNMTCDHINRNKSDYRLCNLRWGTAHEQGKNVTKINSQKSIQNKGVIQYDINCNFIKLWSSRREAARSLSIEDRRQQAG